MILAQKYTKLYSYSQFKVKNVRTDKININNQRIHSTVKGLQTNLPTQIIIIKFYCTGYERIPITVRLQLWESQSANTSLN